MALLLRVIGGHGPAAGHGGTHVFGASGGRIGRSRRCDLVLPDPDCYVSNLHAAVERDERGWTLTDHSTNGIFLNGESVPMPAGSRQRLRDADRLVIGPYTLVVTITPDVSFTGKAAQS